MEHRCGMKWGADCATARLWSTQPRLGSLVGRVGGARGKVQRAEGRERRVRDEVWA